MKNCLLFRKGRGSQKRQMQYDEFMSIAGSRSKSCRRLFFMQIHLSDCCRYDMLIEQTITV